MIGKSAGFLLLLVLTGAFYELYLDIILTKYYLQALNGHKTFYICAFQETPSQLVVFNKDFEAIQPLIVPPFFSLSTKSLSTQPRCFVLSSHQEGFLPGSLTVKGPMHQSRWTLSYAGRLKYQPWEGSYLEPPLLQSIETAL